MSGLSVKKVDTSEHISGGGIPKTLNPGIVMAKLHKVELSQRSEMAKKQNGYYVELTIEGPPIGDGFEGFHHDHTDDKSPRYEGQIGNIKTFTWPYADKTFSSGNSVSRDLEILKDLKRLCEAYGCVDWFEAQDEKHETIEDFVAEFNKSCPLIGNHLNYCITGRQYASGEYKRWDLGLPKWSKDSVPFESVTVPKDDSKLTKFDENNPDHIKFLDTEEMPAFAGDTESDDSFLEDDSEDNEFEV